MTPLCLAGVTQKEPERYLTMSWRCRVHFALYNTPFSGTPCIKLGHLLCQLVEPVPCNLSTALVWRADEGDVRGGEHIHPWVRHEKTGRTTSSPARRWLLIAPRCMHFQNAIQEHQYLGTRTAEGGASTNWWKYHKP